VDVPASDFDSPAKALIRYDLPGFVTFNFPALAERFDWSAGIELLPTELAQPGPGAAVGPRRADLVFRVGLAGPEPRECIVLIEAQSRYDRELAERLFVYAGRLFGEYRLPVSCLVWLTDARRRWRPRRFGLAAPGTELALRFSVAKLLDWEGRWAELEASESRFATATMASLRAWPTRRDPEGRLGWKLWLTQRLYEKPGFGRDDVLMLHRYIDWVLPLPAALARRFRAEMAAFEEARRMPYITSIERLSREEGLQAGLRESVLAALATRFGPPLPVVVERVQGVEDIEELRALLQRALTVGSLAEFSGSMNGRNGGDGD
jgi:hypothetical protein